MSTKTNEIYLRYVGCANFGIGFEDKDCRECTIYFQCCMSFARKHLELSYPCVQCGRETTNSIPVAATDGSLVPVCVDCLATAIKRYYDDASAGGCD